MYLFLDRLMFQLMELPIPLTIDVLMVHPMEHLVGSDWADPGLLYCTNKTPSSLALLVIDHRMT